MQTNIHLSPKTEKQLDSIRAVAYKNGIKGSNKAEVIALAIDIAYKCTESLDDLSFINVTEFKK